MDYFTPNRNSKPRKQPEKSVPNNRKVSTKIGGEFSYISEEISELDLSKSIVDVQLPAQQPKPVKPYKPGKINFTLDGEKRKRKKKKKRKPEERNSDEIFVKKTEVNQKLDNSKEGKEIP